MMRSVLILCLFHAAVRAEPTEAELNHAFCASIGGQTEVRHYLDHSGIDSYVVVDCETDDAVYECGLDKRSSLDSLQQATFAGRITGKQPVVVIYDTDGQEGEIEYRIRIAAQEAGVRYETINVKLQP